MGAWGTKIFDNDSACDWANHLEAKGLQHVKDALEIVNSLGPEYLFHYVSEEALAACEVIACLQGSFGEKNVYTEKMDSWVENNKIIVSPELADSAIAVIDRILSGPSEILEIWEFCYDLHSWKTNVTNLKKRIKQSQS